MCHLYPLANGNKVGKERAVVFMSKCHDLACAMFITWPLFHWTVYVQMEVGSQASWISRHNVWGRGGWGGRKMVGTSLTENEHQLWLQIGSDEHNRQRGTRKAAQSSVSEPALPPHPQAETWHCCHQQQSQKWKRKKKKNNEMGLPSMRKHHAMPASDLESVHEAFLAGIFKTKIEIFSSMIYKISLERWGRTQYNKEQSGTPLLIAVLESMGQARQSHVRVFFVPSPEIRIEISHQFSQHELLKKPSQFFGLFRL